MTAILPFMLFIFALDVFSAGLADKFSLGRVLGLRSRLFPKDKAFGSVSVGT